LLRQGRALHCRESEIVEVWMLVFKKRATIELSMTTVMGAESYSVVMT
jgi:hypothetical protein